MPDSLTHLWLCQWLCASLAPAASQAPWDYACTRQGRVGAWSLFEQALPPFVGLHVLLDRAMPLAAHVRAASMLARKVAFQQRHLPSPHITPPLLVSLPLTLADHVLDMTQHPLKITVSCSCP